jgi:hypothetical protein
MDSFVKGMKKGVKDVGKIVKKGVKEVERSSIVKGVKRLEKSVEKSVRDRIQKKSDASAPSPTPDRTSSPLAPADSGFAPDIPVVPYTAEEVAAASSPDVARSGETSGSYSPEHPPAIEPSPGGKSLVPPLVYDEATKYDKQYFDNWMAQLKAALEPVLPPKNYFETHLPAYLTSLEAMQDMLQVKQAADQQLDALNKRTEPPVTPAEKEAAEKAVADAGTALHNALQVGADVVTNAIFVPTGDSPCPELVQIIQADYETKFADIHATWVQYRVMQLYTSTRAAQWCEQQQAQGTKQLLDLLNNQIPWLIESLQAGGCLDYGRAMQIFHQLQPHVLISGQKEPVLVRLAMAVALQHSTPIAVFDQPNVFVDPVQRYVHYEQAYLFGELDPAFPQFTTWELRMAVDSDATEEQLGWGRESLRNYRPDHVYSNDPQWRYCRIVRTDVAYTNPDWTSSPHTYDQIVRIRIPLLRLLWIRGLLTPRASSISRDSCLVAANAVHERGMDALPARHLGFPRGVSASLDMLRKYRNCVILLTFGRFDCFEVHCSHSSWISSAISSVNVACLDGRHRDG